MSSPRSIRREDGVKFTLSTFLLMQLAREKVQRLDLTGFELAFGGVCLFVLVFKK